jgi:hypothetical protein
LPISAWGRGANRAPGTAGIAEIHYTARRRPPAETPGTKGKRMNILIGVLITFLVVILVHYLVNMLPIDGRAKQIVQIIVIVIGIISLLKYLAVF